jgi:outer membrane protein assembly factor BamD
MNKFFLFIALFAILISCSKEEIKESIIKEKSLDLQVLEAYQEGVKSLETGDVLYAAKKFNEAETLFPQSEWAPKSALMAAYAYYTQNYYSDTIAELERFIRVYPLSKNLDYVYYLLGISYYEQIVDEKKDLQSIIKAKKYFKIVSKNYPNTNYSLDAEYKIDLVNDTLASKEMYIGRYYFDKKKWIPAINRFRTVIDDYETTIYAQEALHRLVEVHYILGLRDEAKKYAKLLGYNYQSSKWYEKSYSVFDKEYKENVKKRDKKRSKKNKTLKKIKSLFSLEGKKRKKGTI